MPSQSAQQRPAALRNPFYALLLLVGVVFAITACGYGLMTVRQMRQFAEDGQPEHPLIGLMERRGFQLLMGELGALALFTFAAIATDDFWARRERARALAGGGAAAAPEPSAAPPAAGPTHSGEEP